MRASVLTHDEVNEADGESFRSQGVNMDDWDYIVLAPVETIRPNTDSYDRDFPEYEQTEWTFDRIMVGCCSNSWYKATYRGAEYAVGVAYHA
jgi:hypothetical protein